MAELVQLVKGNFDNRVVPLKYYSVTISYIMCISMAWPGFSCSCPDNSLINPCERLMSILNLRLQCVSTSWIKSTDDIEAILKWCNSMSDIRRSFESKNILKSQSHSAVLLSNKILHAVHFHDCVVKHFQVSWSHFYSGQNPLQEIWRTAW